MKETIYNNDKSFKILNKLILNKFYTGKISATRFELERKKPTIFSVNNHQIIGILNGDRFDLTFDHKFPMNIAVKIAFGLGLLFSIVALIKGNWFLPIPVFIIPFLITFIAFKLEKKKEISLFTSKFLELYISEYE